MLFQVTLHAKMTMPDLQRNPWNLYLINNVEDIVVNRAWRVALNDAYSPFKCRIKGECKKSSKINIEKQKLIINNLHLRENHTFLPNDLNIL